MIKRNYTADDLELFAQYRDIRVPHTPPRCVGGAQCWAEHGPPAINANMQCVGCGGVPLRPLDRFRGPGR